VVLVLHNGDLNQVTWEMRAMAGDATYEASQDVPEFPYAQYAQLLGLNGIRVDHPDQVGPAWERAFAADPPTIVEVIADADVPPIPPNVELSQVKSFTNAVPQGDPDTVGMIKQGIKGKLAEYAQ
jgi:pyruvate dehydrogenase (quinone)